MPKRPLKTLARMLGALALFVLYGIGSTQTGYLHQLFHPEEVTAVHTIAQEQDPCHRSLYHGVDTGCRHEFHLAKMQSCGLFHTLVHADQILFESSTLTSHGACLAPEISIREGIASIIAISRLTRGPPVGLHA